MCIGDGFNYMIVGDLMRVIVLVFLLLGLYLVREGYFVFERFLGELKCFFFKFFMLFDINGDGLILFLE